MLKDFLVWLTKPVLILVLIIWLIKEPCTFLEAAKEVSILLLLLIVMFLIVQYFIVLINWLLTIPRRNKIKRLFPLISTNLSDEHVKFLLYDLGEMIEEFQHEAIYSTSTMNIPNFEKINRIYSLLESLRYRNISESDIQELNTIYGFDSK